MASNAPQNMDNVVSFESEKLILVDDNDQAIGQETKALCHNGHGLLHRAFSLFVFNTQGELLLQQRSRQKRLWPGYWANSCCSHPRAGEQIEQAINRRLMEELGLACDLSFVYKFKYQADFGDLGAEHELCSVFIGHSDEPVTANKNEVEAWRFISQDELTQEMQQHPDHFTPWLKMEWEQLCSVYRHLLPAA